MSYILGKSNEEINSNSGITLIGQKLQGLASLKSIDTMSMPNVKKGRIPHSDILKSAVALMSLGYSDYSDIELFRKDMLFNDAIGIDTVPSAETFRQRLDTISSSGDINEIIDKLNVELLGKVNNS